MYYVYLIQSTVFPEQKYVGYSTNVKNRIEEHNEGKSLSTNHARPWEMVACMAFKDLEKAKNFEKYLKSHAGRAFAQKRFW